jgi:hypothetical protein
MASVHDQTLTRKILENILFLAEVFGDKAEEDIPNVPVLELAKCFELSPPTRQRPRRRRAKHWSLWQ